MTDEEAALLKTIDALSSFVIGDQTAAETLSQVLELGQQAVGPADMVGMTLLVENGRPTTAVMTEPGALEFDRLQYERGSGPCLDAFRELRVMRIQSMPDARWPEFCDRAFSSGLRSSLSVPLIVARKGIGAINFYSRVEAAFTDDDADLAGRFAAQAAVVLANSQAYWGAYELSEHLTRALESRGVIEQAKGVLIEQSGVSADEAFDLLVRASQRENRKLRDIATAIVAHAQERHR